MRVYAKVLSDGWFRAIKSTSSNDPASSSREATLPRVVIESSVSWLSFFSREQVLKSFSASFIETNLTQVSNLPIELQVKLHEFRNHLSTLNQEINMANDIHKLTFDSSISGVNHEIISKELISKYAFIQGMCKRVADKLGAVVSSTM